jgi:hypothetical protein
MRLCALPVALCEGGTVLTDQQAFLWRRRLREERAIRNLTDTHVRILEFTLGAVEDGADKLSHAAVAESLLVGISTVRDAYRRAKAIGLLEWEPQYRLVGGQRRRTTNLYRAVMPAQTSAPMPGLRRDRKAAPVREPLSSSLTLGSSESGDQREARERRCAAKYEGEKRLRRMRFYPRNRLSTANIHTVVMAT